MNAELEWADVLLVKQCRHTADVDLLMLVPEGRIEGTAASNLQFLQCFDSRGHVLGREGKRWQETTLTRLTRLWRGQYHASIPKTRPKIGGMFS